MIRNMHRLQYRTSPGADAAAKAAHPGQYPAKAIRYNLPAGMDTADLVAVRIVIQPAAGSAQAAAPLAWARLLACWPELRYWPLCFVAAAGRRRLIENKRRDGLCSVVV